MSKSKGLLFIKQYEFSNNRILDYKVFESINPFSTTTFYKNENKVEINLMIDKKLLPLEEFMFENILMKIIELKNEGKMFEVNKTFYMIYNLNLTINGRKEAQ